MTSLPAFPARAALTVALLAALPGAAQAIDIQYEVGAGVLHSDNIGLSDTDPQSDTVFSPQLRFDAEQAGSTFRLNARGNVQYLDYLDNTFDDGFRGAFTGAGVWTMIPERLDWTFEDYLSRQPIDTLSAFSPGNEQQANLFVTGPSLYLHLGEATTGQIDLRYSNSYAEENEDFNSDRYNAAARVERSLSPTQAISANVEATRVRYDSALNADYTRYDGYGRYTSQFRTVDLSVDLGYSRLEFENSPKDDWLPLVRGNLAWHMSPRSTLDADLSYEYSDAADDLVVTDINGNAPDLDDFGNPTVAVRPEVYKQRRLELGYQFTGERVGFEVRPYYQRISYIDTTLQDERDFGGFAELSYRLRPRMTLLVAAAHEDRKFEGLARRDKESIGSIALVNEFTQHWSARFELQRRERNSTEIGQDYHENAAIVSFTYRR